MDAAFFEAVESRISEVLTVQESALTQYTQVLQDAARYLCVSDNAKRVRPMLVLYFGKAVGLDPKQLVDAAVAAELIHSASLLHDDVVDEATMRRGRPSVNVHYSNAVAVLSGNFLLSRAFSLLGNYPQRIVGDAIQAISEMTSAAVAELEIRGAVDTDIGIWQQIAFGKTGALFSWCGLVAALSAGRDDAAISFHHCGLHLGTTFQMADDLRDLVDTAGLKDRFSDIRNREPSYPIILAAQSSSEFRHQLQTNWQRDAMTETQVAHLGATVLQTGAAKATLDAMKSEISHILSYLKPFESTTGAEQMATWLLGFHESAATSCKTLGF